MSKVKFLKWAYRRIQITLDDVEILVDLVILPILDFDNILGMDCVSDSIWRFTPTHMMISDEIAG